MAATAPVRPDLAFKAYEIEERIAVHFHRPVGMVFARAAQTAGWTPTAVTLVATAIGIAGGSLLYVPRFAAIAFALLVLHGILDSSDGQLARMTGRSSELGRVLDGVSGYLTHIAIYVALLAAALGDGAGAAIGLVVAAAALSNVVHAQLYDYHRTTYEWIALAGRIAERRSGSGSSPVYARLAAGYETMQRALSGRHADVVHAIAARARDGRVRSDDRAAYRRLFYPRVRGWNLLGDNTRFYAVGVLALVGRLDWFFWFVIGPMNVMLAVLWLRQAHADRQFLANDDRDPTGHD